FYGTEHRFLHQLLSDLPGETEVHSRVGQSLHDHENVCRTGGAETGRHVDHVFGFDIDLFTERSEKPADKRAIVIIDGFATGPGRDAGTDLGRSVWHRTYDAPSAKLSRYVRDRRTRDDR